jgi:hypothetical protein
MRLLASGRDPRTRSGRLHSCLVRRACHRIGGPRRTGRRRFRYRQVLRPESASGATARLIRLQLRRHRRHARHDVDFLGSRRCAWNRHGQLRRVPAQLCRGNPAVQSDRRARVERFSTNESRLPAPRSVLLRHDNRVSTGRSPVDPAGHKLVSRNRFRHRRRHASGALLRRYAELHTALDLVPRTFLTASDFAEFSSGKERSAVARR